MDRPNGTRFLLMRITLVKGSTSRMGLTSFCWGAMREGKLIGGATPSSVKGETKEGSGGTSMANASWASTEAENDRDWIAGDSGVRQDKDSLVFDVGSGADDGAWAMVGSVVGKGESPLVFVAGSGADDGAWATVGSVVGDDDWSLVFVAGSSADDGA